MYVLNIETATKNCSVAIAKNGETVICKEVATEGYSHAEKLHVFIEELLKNVSITFQDIKAIAVSKGPGSYTGLRIGVSAAKGLCYALGIPLISIDTLSLLAAQVVENDGLIVPMIDARRMEVYSAIFNANKEIIREVKSEVLSEHSFVNYTQKIYFVGDSNAKAKLVLTNSNFVFKDDIIYPSSRFMSDLSYRKFLISEFEDVAYFEPCYLKDFMIVK
jgi:tRNA threonylcarbamoyladenosine biosynthesis protein TsaB